MANFGPIQVPSDLSNIQTFPDLVRFVSAFVSQAAGQYNGLFANKTVRGSIGLSGTIVTGSSNFGCSITATGSYFIAFREAFSVRPTVTYGCETLGLVRGASFGLSGFFVLTTGTTGVLQNLPFSFIAEGGR